MVVAIGSILAILNGNRKARNETLVINNLQTAIESMNRIIRNGTTFHCGGGNYSVPAVCPSEGSDQFAVEAHGGSGSTGTDQVVFRHNAELGIIERSMNGGASWDALTAPPVTIDLLRFRTTSIPNGNPTVLITIGGTTGTENVRSASSFHLQTTISQRFTEIPTAVDSHDVIINEF
jgi:hypothetical protein